ncbi:SDR family NAD(P)-dependent oxidoreductase [Staphylococcus pseudoxylosus]|uniref:SDR family NAD(P)-dependent oxidoreductase n=1 Tax=Staphylococcus pseudoxylosus TaxID=2282419 RepID=UPI002DBC8FBE|nr:SDR family NAD(P)-dependent oxidoreductase [Staphylococcus pseudoxylosus]MEB7754893.1 SDR family oxidoreductase [Staphylococcus pseudoxylosus]
MEITDFKMDFFSLNNKTAIITGGNSGLGRAFSVALASAGANIFVPTISDDNGETQKLVEDRGRKFTSLKIDITENGAPKKVIDKCLETFGSVDILINSAGINILDKVESFNREKWDPMIKLNLTAAFEMAYETSKIMKENQSGKIINICSLFSFLGGQMSPAYAATKHGLAGFTKAYCDELGRYNIQVNGIAPGYFATELTEKTRNNPENNKKIIDHIPAKRWGEPLDLMGTTVFLSSPASNYINGHILSVDGGYLVR